MLTARNNEIGKRDLHVGGVGSKAPVGLSTGNPEHVRRTPDAWLESARETYQDANDYLRKRPWSALGLVAFVGLAAGYLLSRRS